MRPTRDEAAAKVRNFYKKAKALISMAGGEVKPGMFQMVAQMTGGFNNARVEDLEAVNNMTEEEWMEYAMPKFFPGYFGEKDKTTPQTLPAPIDYTAKLDSMQENIVSLGAMNVRICGKLDKLIELNQQVLNYWKGGEQ